MTDLERIEVQVQRQIDLQNARIDKIDVKLDAFIQEMRDFKTEMRDRDNQRAAETAALRAEMIENNKALRAEMIESDKAIRADMAESNKKIAEEISGIKTELKGLDKYFHNLTITAIVGVGAAVIGIGVMVVGLLMK